MRSILLMGMVALAGCDRRATTELGGTFAFYGFDFASVKESAERDLEGLRGFMLFAGRTDGAASDEYAWHLGKLLERWGDEVFARVVDSVSSSVRAPVLDALAFEGCLGENDRVWNEFRARYPRVSQRIIAPTAR